MLWTVAIAMQGVAGPPDVAPRAKTSAPRACPVDSGDDVVVCAPDQERFRLRTLPEDPGSRSTLPAAALNIGGATLAAESEAGQAIGGAPPRAMMRLKFRF